MTKEDIKKALEICTDDYHSCNGCPYYKVIDCSDTLRVNARELIIEQENEIERLKAENDTNMQYIRMMGIQSHIKTSNEQVKQAQIDILNKAKKKLDSAPNGWAYTGYIDDLIEEVQNE